MRASYFCYMKFKKTKTLSTIDAAYLAGIIDGEGAIMLTRNSPNEERRLAIDVSNNDLVMLEWIKKKTGVGHICSKKQYKEHHLPSFTWGTGGRQAIDLLVQVEPFMLTARKLRAKLIIADYIRLTPRNGRYTTAMKRERDRFVEKFYRIGTGGKQRIFRERRMAA